jgi:hypothetical protein
MTVWTFATQVMANGKAKNQTNNLTLNHKKSRIDPTSMCVDGVQYTVGKLLMKATTLL